MATYANGQGTTFIVKLCFGDPPILHPLAMEMFQSWL